MIGNLSVAKNFQISNGSTVVESGTRKGFRSFRLQVGAGLGLAGGFSAGVFGFLLTALTWLSGNEAATASVGKSAAYLIFAMMPLMALGAHCLDKLEALKKAAQDEFCRRHGLTNKSRE